MNDGRYAARMLAKSPGFTLIAAGLLAGGIGANTVIFSAMDAVMLRPLAVRNPEQLVRMVQRSPQLGTRSNFSYRYYEDLRDHASSLSIVFGEMEQTTAMNQPSPAEEVRANLVTPEYFEALGVPALFGRVLTREDAKDAPGAPPAVLSYAFWRRRFDADPRAIGETITLKNQKFVIVGVMPREFNGILVDTSPDLQVPLRAAPMLVERGDRRPMQIEELVALSLAARLRPGVTLAQARPECLELWRQSTEEFGRQYRQDFAEGELRRGMDVEAISRGVSVLRDRFGTALKLLVASAGLLLLMVCANVAGLLLARGASRREEIAVRLAMGATRGRIARQVLTESLLLALMGAAGGLLIAWIATPMLARAFPPIRDLMTNRLNLTIEFGIDARVLFFSMAISCACVILAGLAPAMSAARMNLDAILRGARSSSGWSGRQALIVFQIALCTMLLAGAGLLARTFTELRSVDAGFDREHVVTFTANPALASYTAAQTDALRIALTERVRGIPGVAGVALSSRALMRGSGVKMTVARMGQRAAPADFLNASINWVSPEYFATMGMRILSGRDFRPDEASGDRTPSRVIVNETFVRRFFPEIDPVGKLFGGAGDQPAKGMYEIIGVVSDAKYRSLREPMTPTFYNVWKPEADTFQLIVRTREQPEGVIEPVRRALQAIDPALPFTEIETMSEEVEASTAPERTTAMLASIFGAVAAALTGVGIYGLLAYAVAARRREIGIRMAIGARPANIARMIGTQAVAMAAAGVVAGLIAAMAAAPWIRSLLYGVAPADPVALAGAAIFVMVIAAAATAIPAAHAIGIDPAAALREE